MTRTEKRRFNARGGILCNDQAGGEEYLKLVERCSSTNGNVSSINMILLVKYRTSGKSNSYNSLIFA